MRALCAGEPVKDRRKRLLAPERLDALSWPEFLWEWLEMKGSELAHLKHTAFRPAPPGGRPQGPSADFEAWLKAAKGGNGRPASEGPLEEDPDFFVPPPPTPAGAVKDEEPAAPTREKEEAREGEGAGVAAQEPAGTSEPSAAPAKEEEEEAMEEEERRPRFVGPIPGLSAVKDWQKKRIAEVRRLDPSHGYFLLMVRFSP